MLSTVGIFMHTKYWELLYVEHCGKMYLHKIPRNALWSKPEYHYQGKTTNLPQVNDKVRHKKLHRVHLEI